MRNPTLYKPGMENKYFSSELMVKWILYSFAHGYWVFLITYYALNACDDQSVVIDDSKQASKWYGCAVQENGHTFSLWLAGHTTYGACIFIANLVVFHRHYSHQAVGGMLISCMILAFFVFSWYQSGFDELENEELQERS